MKNEELKKIDDKNVIQQHWTVKNFIKSKLNLDQKLKTISLEICGE